MTRTIAVSIPTPCAEQWSSFTPTDTGGFCGSCRKNVIDFTNATDDEIIAFISRKPEHACGKFRSSQLKTYSPVQPVIIKPGFTLPKAGVISMLLLLISKPSVAQIRNTPPTEQVTDQQASRKKSWTNHFITVKGTVRSPEDNSPLPSVSVVQKGTTNATFTDSHGNFELKIDTRVGKTLSFSFIGFQSSEFTVQEDNLQISITMIPDVTILGGMEIMGEVATDQPYAEPRPGLFKRIWKKIKSVF